MIEISFLLYIVCAPNWLNQLRVGSFGFVVSEVYFRMAGCPAQVLQIEPKCELVFEGSYYSLSFKMICFLWSFNVVLDIHIVGDQVLYANTYNSYYLVIRSLCKDIKMGLFILGFWTLQTALRNMWEKQNWE